MPASLNFLFPQSSPRIIRYGQDLVGRIFTAGAYAWAHPIVVQARTEALERARVLAVGWGARYVSLSSYFGAANLF
jgi:hypothetical protein